jgi:hypothetical protein
MKITLTAFIILLALKGFAQSPAEADVLNLSNKIFAWEVGGKIDSLENVFDEKFVVVNGAGEIQTRKQYIANLTGGNFIHDSIEIAENTAAVVNNTATVVGKGKFTVTNNGNKVTLRLAYLEVFTRPGPTAPWKILAIHASRLPD